MEDKVAVARSCAQLLLVATSIIALILCPHSKVEESFPLQATHDLYYRPPFQEYDHLQFPGVVPRSFVGPLLLASLCQILTWILSPVYNLHSHPMQVQLMARGFLLTLVLHGWFRLAHAVDKQHWQSKHKTWRGTYLLFITAVQFHMPFYASRMLPNTFALWLVLYAYADWLLQRYQRAAIYLVIATTVFRCDVLLLLFTVGLQWLIQRKLTLLQAIKVGVLTGLVSLLLSVPIDSYLWQTYWVWPEGQVFYFNAILGKSSEWGTSPWHWYLTTGLPKAMLFTAALVPLSLIRLPEHVLSLSNGTRFSRKIWIDTSILPYLIPIVGFVGLYSCLGHKEIRFLFPAMPIINLAAATGLERLHNISFSIQKDKSPSRGSIFLWLGGALLCLLSLLVSLVFVGVSRLNYPGGTAMQQLLAIMQTQEESSGGRVYIDVAAAMTGVSLFSQRAAGPNWIFDKAGYEAENAIGADFSEFTHVLTEHKDIKGFRVLSTAAGNPRFNWRRGRIETTDGIYILQRDSL